MRLKIIIVLIAVLASGCVAQQTSIAIPDESSGSSEETFTNNLNNYLQNETSQILRFADVAVTYDENDMPVMTDKLLSMDGTEVYMQGYMAPPLSLDNEFFVLTRVPVFACPFCSSPETWTGDFVVIYADDWHYETKRPVEVSGILEIGASVDEETGLVSLVRIQATDVSVLD